MTLPDVFGDWYYLDNGVIYQERATPLGYLVRLELWADLFGSAETSPEGAAPIPIGVTPIGQIVTRQKFIETSPASQQAEQNVTLRTVQQITRRLGVTIKDIFPD